MLKALRALRELDLLPRDEVLALDNAYRFLRRVEHRLQIEAEQQTHTVPDEPEALQRLARSLRFSSADEFTAALHARMATVRPIFERIISETPAESAKIDLEAFNEPQRAEKALRDLEQGPPRFHVAPRTRQIFHKLRPALLNWLTKAAGASPHSARTRTISILSALIGNGNCCASSCATRWDLAVRQQRSRSFPIWPRPVLLSQPACLGMSN